MRVKIKEFGKPNKNGMIFTKESYKKLPNKVPVVKHRDTPDYMIKDMIGEAGNFSITKTGISVDVKFFNKLLKKEELEKIYTGCVLRAEGAGNIKEDKKTGHRIVENFEIVRVAAIPKEDAA